MANTSLGNTIINVALHLYLASKYNLGKVAICAMGDDVVMMTNKKMDEELAEKFFLSAGLKSKFIFCENHWDIQFCSGRFWPTSNGYVFG